MSSFKKFREYVMPRGFPRPRGTHPLYGDNLPVPYVAEADNMIALLHDERDLETLIYHRCQMCGLAFNKGPHEIVSIAVTNECDVDWEHGLTHLKCATIVEKFCPAFYLDDHREHRMMVKVSFAEACEHLDRISRKDISEITLRRVERYIAQQEASLIESGTT